MSTSRARLLADGGGGGGGGTYAGQAFHGFSRDADGLLTYTKESLATRGTTVRLTDGSVFDDPTDLTAGSRNDATKKAGETYDQWLLDSTQLDFYINDDGFLVAAIGENVTYNGPN